MIRLALWILLLATLATVPAAFRQLAHAGSLAMAPVGSRTPTPIPARVDTSPITRKPPAVVTRAKPHVIDSHHTRQSP